MSMPIIITFAVFGGVLALIFGLYFAVTAARTTERSEVKRRLHAIAMRQPGESVMPSILREEMLSEIPVFNKILFKLEIAKRSEQLLDQADVKITVGALFLTVGVLFAVGLSIGVISGRGILLGLVLGLILATVPILYLMFKRQQRVKKFTEQFPDTLDMLARSLRAGHSFNSAMQVVADEMPDPISKLFRVAYDEQTLGLSLAESLHNMTERINSIDLMFFVVAVNIQRETGGNLAEILEKLGITIRERFRILGQLKVYTAQGRLSGYILAALPIFMAFIIWLINPDYMKVLFESKTGIYMVAAAIVMQVMGFFVIRKIIHIQI